MLKKFLLVILFFSGYNFTGAQTASNENKALSQICDCPQQSTAGKGTFYFSGGYNLDWFSRSTIHFKSGPNAENNYDFKLHKLRAIDRDGLDELFTTDITIPQYSFRLGYFFNDKRDLGIELNYDHVKYVVVQNQRAHLTGIINEKQYDMDTVVTKDFVMFEHTNGANYAMVNFMKRDNMYKSPNKKHWLGYVFKAGFGFVYPRSDTKIMGSRRNDIYHVAGYVGGIESGVRYDAFKYFFFETTLKGAYAKYVNVRLEGDGKGTHGFFSLEYIALVGFQFPL